jgi:hypothetical protein
LELINLDSYSFRESILKVDIVFVEMSKYLQTSLAAMTHLAEGLCFNALLTLKVENSLICLVGTRIPTESKMDGIIIIIIIIIIHHSNCTIWCGKCVFFLFSD